VLPNGVASTFAKTAGEAVPRPRKSRQQRQPAIGDTVARAGTFLPELPGGWRNSSVAIPCHR